MKHVQLPRFPTWYNIRGLLTRLQPNQAADGRLVIDWSQVRFSDPAGLVLVAAYCVTEARRGTQLDFWNFDPTGYEARMRIKPMCGLADDYRFSRRRPGRRFTDLHRVTGERQSAEYAAEAVRVMQLSNPAVRTLADYSLREILDNVHAHAFSPCNAIAASQLYENRSQVVYAVADTGRGIPALVRQRVGPCSAAEAIRRAAEPGFTTVAGPRGHMGLGLTVSKEIAAQAGGRFAILSDDAFVTWEDDAANELQTAGWHGTGVIGIIGTDTAVTLQDVLTGIRR